MSKIKTVVTGSIFHFLRRPQSVSDVESFEYFNNGYLALDANGKIQEVGNFTQFQMPENIDHQDWTGHLICPGFVDTHIHFAQTDMIASYGEQLLDWLNKYTFPEEKKFSDPDHARQVADFFLEELLRNGTTTASVFPTVHSSSVSSFFEAANQKNMRMICGKIMMDRNCPPELQDDTSKSEETIRRLIAKWHGTGRLTYSLTPRFAPTSSPEQLQMAGRLFGEVPGIHLQSHLAENLGEIEWVKELFPKANSYLDVYEEFGLLGERSIYAHCIHISDLDRMKIKNTETSIAFAPSSNSFLGSGIFDLKAAMDMDIKVGMSTDVGAGTSFSILQTLGDAYKALQLRGQNLNSIEAFYLATLGGARALCLEDKIGNFLPGKEGDFIVLDPAATPLFKRRTQGISKLEDLLFTYMILGDDRAIKATYILGKGLYRK